LKKKQYHSGSSGFFFGGSKNVDIINNLKRVWFGKPCVMWSFKVRIEIKQA